MSTYDISAYLPKYVEIETSRFCNRRCPWCPNGRSAERTTQELMPWSLFSRITDELADLGFSGNLGFTNYNEPLANPRLLKELQHVRLRLPTVSVRLYTNGDLLTRDLLDAFASHDVSFIRVSAYPPSTLEELAPSQARIESFIKRKGIGNLDWSFKRERQGLIACSKLIGMEVEILSPDLHTFSYRGGTSVVIDPLPHRTDPCFLTTHSASIDYRGRMKMCCCVFPDDPDHHQYILGDLNHDSFLKIWTSQRLVTLRRAHARGIWSESRACVSCRHHSPKKPSNFAILTRTEQVPD